MDAQLESLIAADEQARARVDAAREAARMRIEAARQEHLRRQDEELNARRQAIAGEVRRIDDEAARAVAARRAARARYSEARRAAAATVLAEAGDIYARIVRTGSGPRGPS